MGKRISYIYDKELNKQLDKIPPLTNRSNMVHELVFSFGLHSKMTLCPVSLATDDEILSFHSQEYLNFLKSTNDSSDLENYADNEEEFGLGYDCPLVEGIYDFVKAVAGGSLTAASTLVNREANIAINWCGGWHHAQRDEAAGFCYVNDIVCTIHKLLQSFERVLYIDLDVHHGDGVENAFNFTQRVVTLSLHQYESGFYPGTGSLSNIGRGNGRFYTVNVPLQEGIRDETYTEIFDRVTSSIQLAFKPDVIVVQCGADSLSGDHLGTLSLTLKGLGHCVEKVLSWEKPTLFLGGGGYNLANVARCWTYLTSLIIGCEIPSDIPDNRYFHLYGPGYDLEITPNNRKDLNKREKIEECLNIINENIQHIQTDKIIEKKSVD